MLNQTLPSLTVKQLNIYIKSMLESDINLRSIYVKGEISNYIRHSKSGHIYLSLKDSDAVVKVVMFNSSAEKLTFFPNDGMKVIIHGKISLYERDGQYQIYADDIFPDGIGALYVAYLQLKDKLEKEGLFDQANKKPLPKYPEAIGVATSPTGAAIRDVVSVLKRRYPYARVKIYPCIVQGAEAAESIKKAINFFNKKIKVDVILITRGGGAFEDLAAFNDEGLARAVFNSKIPVVSAIGHEVDYSILDFVADSRAATPSVAAEIIAPDKESLKNDVAYYKNNIIKGLNKKIYDNIQKLNYLKKKTDMQQAFSKQSIYLDRLYDKITSSIKNNLTKQQYILSSNVKKLHALSPLNVLSRGYSLAYNEDNQLIKCVDNIKSGDIITLKIKDGEIYCVTKDSRKYN